jgi:hypothetical protein
LGSVYAIIGDELKCHKCGHTKLLTSEYLAKILIKHFPGRLEKTLHVNELKKFKCKACGSKETKLVEHRDVASSQVITNKENLEGQMCHQCGGDGGISGRCPRCGGNGFEPSR